MIYCASRITTPVVGLAGLQVTAPGRVVTKGGSEVSLPIRSIIRKELSVGTQQIYLGLNLLTAFLLTTSTLIPPEDASNMGSETSEPPFVTEQSTPKDSALGIYHFLNYLPWCVIFVLVDVTTMVTVPDDNHYNVMVVCVSFSEFIDPNRFRLVAIFNDAVWAVAHVPIGSEQQPTDYGKYTLYL
ncbi:hypothetical protein AAG570_009183 [Ranatra chinensis]|uniref:Uncharacterized protein n=1 Tax=Ranatra chinensis TaxID=642074 RepID=A0ABD0ZA33_9HEMI